MTPQAIHSLTFGQPVATGNGQGSFSAALWRFEHRDAREVSAPANDGFATVCLGISGRMQDRFSADGRLRFDETWTPDCSHVVRDGEAPHGILSAASATILHLYLPDTLIRRVAAEVAGTRDIELNPSLVRGDRRLRELCGAIVSELNAPGGPTAMALDAAASLLAVHLVRFRSNLSGTAAIGRETREGGLAPWQERRAIDYLRAHFAEAVTLAQLAALTSRSTFHFARQFKQSCGRPPHAYLRRLRCERAEELLAGTNLSITEIAAQVGYETPQAFARMFRAEVGASPSEYRRERTS